MAIDMWDCEYFARCKNNQKCMICGPEQRLLLLPGDAQKKKAAMVANRHKQGSHEEDSWKELEQYVADQLNAIPTSQESKRELRSGGLEFLPGDVRDSVITPECKEREQYTANGEKTFKLDKAWLEKVAEEAKLTGKFPAVIFRYKNDDQAYFVQTFETLAGMVHQIKFLQEENAQLRVERDAFKKAAESRLKEE